MATFENVSSAKNGTGCMILREFPDAEWLKKQARSNFADRKGVRGQQLPDSGWPSVVLSTRSSGTERADIAGPFSVFVNLTGSSVIRTEGLELPIQQDTYCITNKGQVYDLIIPRGPGTQTFNVHFGERLFLETVYSLQNREASLLDNPFGHGGASFRTHPRTVWKDDFFKRWIAQLAAFYENDHAYPLPDEAEMLSAFLEYILLCDSREMKGMQSIPSLKPSTQRELMRRVLVAIDFIHDRYATGITLDDLSEVSALSKFHLQRTFKKIKGRTPQQYLAELRLLKARELMESTDMSLHDIALATGFSELSAFSRFFHYQAKMYPSAYREKLAMMVK